jgi:uroporphyrinogen III methyltransferase/synthase
MSASFGKVFLVGAGPGDPGLLTVRGRELLERADVVVFDHLIHESIPGLARPAAERIFVGKRPDHQPLAQDDINRLLITLARKHACVVRLKGGDPFVFGRGGEEALALAGAGVPFEIVPGVTAGLGATAYAGIPVTHRGLASSVTFVSGHATADDACPASRLDRLHLDGTLVFYMSASRLEENLRAVMAAGRPPGTPAAVIESGAYPRQRVIEGTLADLVARAASLGVQSPALVVVGEVARLRDQLKWFEDRPLFGRRVVVTRAKDRAAELIRLLRERGADIFEFPTVEIDASPAAAPLGDLRRFAWIVLASINAVETLFARMAAEDLDARSLHGVRLCAISARTAEALHQRALRADLTPAEYQSDFVADEMERAGGPLRGRLVLMPRPEIGRSALPGVLRARGAGVHELPAYLATIPRDSAQLASALLDFAPDYVVFNSASAARNLRAILGPERTATLARSAVFAAIGPIAAQAAAESGMPAAVVPARHTIPDLVTALADHDADRRTREGERPREP